MGRVVLLLKDGQRAVVITSGRMPKWLGRALIVGGAGYLLSAFVGYGIVDAGSWLVEGLTYLATVGEFWMIGYLLIVGIRPPTAVGEPVRRLT